MRYLVILAAAVFFTVFIYGEKFFIPGKIARVDNAEPLDDWNVLDLAFKEGNSLETRFLNDNYFVSELKIEDIDLNGVSISGNFFIKGRIVPGNNKNNPVLEGKFVSRDMKINSRSFKSLSMSFDFKNTRLGIRSLRLGDSYELKGMLDLAQPFYADLTFIINRAYMRDLAFIMGLKNPELVLGVMSGMITAKGKLDEIVSEGFINSKNGKIGSLDYDSAVIKIKGSGPIINISDSNIKHGKGTIDIEGYMDLRGIAKKNFYNSLKIKSDMKEIAWKEWDITKSGIDELRMTKDISENIQVGFKTMRRDPLTTYYKRENPEEMSLEYNMGLENLQMKLRENEEFFGIEHNVKF